ncbi:MAG: hypothetical protein HZA54_18855 [Planctomycetes bacterium]|nr:hypothetical protein [Planctomycetota bacterium]
MFDKMNEFLRRLSGRGEVTDEMTTLLKQPKKRKEALKLARETRHRLEESKGRALEDIGVLTAREKELIEKGRHETGPSQRVLLARQIQEVRGRIAEINSRLEGTVNKPLKVYAVLTQLLETLAAQEDQPIPDMRVVEDLAIANREYNEKIDQTVALVEGLQSSLTQAAADRDLDGILAELEGKKRVATPALAAPALTEADADALFGTPVAENAAARGEERAKEVE